MTTTTEAGSSLIELLMGSVLAITVLGAVTASALHQSALQRLDGELFMAHAACESALESVRGMEVADVLALDGQGFDVPGPAGQPGGLPLVPGDEDGLPGRFEVSVDKHDGDNVLYRVKLTVEWGLSRPSHRYGIESLIIGRPTG